MAPKAKRRKVVCNTCKRVFDSDYRKRHDLKHHGGKLQRIYGAGAPANPFEVVKSKRSVDVASSPSPPPSADDHFDFALPPPCDPVVDENNISSDVVNPHRHFLLQADVRLLHRTSSSNPVVDENNTSE